MPQATTLRAPTVARDRHGLAAFAAGLPGRAFWPDDAGYAEACRIWNAMIERRPALVVRPRDSSDVVACVRFVRDSGLPLSVRGGGHNIAGTALCSGGVMIDFSTHRAVKVDASSGWVEVQPGHLGRPRPRHASVRPGRARRDRLGDRGCAGSRSAAASAG
jgi:FAD binding domain